MTLQNTCLIAFYMPFVVVAQTTPEIQWQRCLGGTGIDQGGEIAETTDGNYVVIGSTTSTNGDVVGNDGGYDMWVIKLDPDGEIIWQKTYGGSGLEGGYSILGTTDGGCIALGRTESNDGDVSGYHGVGVSGGDIWIVKLDASGTIEWQRALGGSAFDFATGLTLTADGGYVIAGNTTSTDGDVTANQGGGDAWIIKLTVAGEIEWQGTYGGSGNDGYTSIIQTMDGGYLTIGYTESNNGDVIGNHGMGDMWVVLFDEGGDLVWQRALGGAVNDGGSEAIETAEGEIMIAGYTASSNGDVSGFHGGAWDAWMVRLDANGELLWQDCFGGSSNDRAVGVVETADGGCEVLCTSSSTNGDVGSINGGNDHWLIRLDDAGALLWERSMGGSTEDSPQDLLHTADGGFATVGFTNSNNGDVAGNHGGLYDVWVVKLSTDPTSINAPDPEEHLALFPNPTHSDALLTYTLDRSAHIRIELLDATGKLVSTVFSGPKPPGQHTIGVPVAAQPAGSYVVVVKVDGEVLSKKVLKL